MLPRWEQTVIHPAADGLLARLESIAQQARDAHAFVWVPELELAAAGLRADLDSLSPGAL